MEWVIITNTNTCRIYNYDKKHVKLSLLTEISHPDLKLKTSDVITTERPGHYHKGESARGAYEPRMDPKEVEIDRFSHEIAALLDKGRNENAYEKLIIITAPHMNGLLFKHLNKHVKELVAKNIQKDLLNMNEREITDFIKTHTQFSG